MPRPPRTRTAHAHHPRHDKLDVQQRTQQGRVPALPSDSIAMRCMHASHVCSFGPDPRGNCNLDPKTPSSKRDYREVVMGWYSYDYPNLYDGPRSPGTK